MLVFKRTALAVIMLAAMVVPAVAATLDHGRASNFVVWAFLVLCGLIVVAQVFPLIRKMNEDAQMTAEKARLKRQHETH
jgi:quinol-cytochrome oxidoreductase complex cytochrome b subunit